MPAPRFSRPFIIAFAAVVIFAAVFAAACDALPKTGWIDLPEYWAAARLFFAGHDPYDPKLLLEAQRAVRPLTEPVIMWNPPWLLPALYPLTLLSLPDARVIWAAMSLLVLGISITLIVAPRAQSSRENLYWMSLLATYMPVHLALYCGQISPWLLLGWAGFLACLERGRLGAGAGALLAITLLKPHLLYLVYLYLGVAFLYGKLRAVALGALAAALGCSLAALLIQPQVFSWYVHATGQAPIYFQTPTLGSWLQLVTDLHLFAIRFLPTAVTALTLLPWMISRRGIILREDLLALVPLSLLTSPYGWPYDRVLFLPTAYWIVSAGLREGGARSLLAPVLLLLCNLIDALPALPHEMQYSVWFSAAYAAIAWYFRLCRCTPAPVSAGAPS